jgi:hypothetical protein
MWVIIGLGFIFFAVVGYTIGNVAGRTKGFENCWKQYLKDNWDKKEQKV